MQPIKRRALLQGLTALGIAGCAQIPTNNKGPAHIRPARGKDYEKHWQLAEKIITQTPLPHFPDRDFHVTRYGAVGDGKTDNSAAFRKAISACHTAGGGRVVVTEGNFLCGPIHLKSNINLHLERDATISFLTDTNHYLPAVFTRWEGMEMMGYSPLIYAYQKENIAITGEGTLDGQASMTHWWPWSGKLSKNRKDAFNGDEGPRTQAAGRRELMAQVEAGVPPEQRHFAEGYYFRPPFVQPYRCKNVLVEGIKITNAPFWLLHPTLCENVTVRGVRFESMGPNSDGCDPESCKNVVIENCFFDTGDDCVAIKSGRNNDGRRINVPSENIVIRNCKMRAGHGGVVIGSEISGGVRNVFAENNEMSSPDLERGFRIKTNSIRGGQLENLFMRNCTIGEVREAIVINFYYEEGDAGKFDPTVRNVVIENLHVNHAQQAFNIRGFARAPIQDLHLKNVTIVHADEPGIIENVEGLDLDNVLVNGKRFTL